MLKHPLQAEACSTKIKSMLRVKRCLTPSGRRCPSPNGRAGSKRVEKGVGRSLDPIPRPMPDVKDLNLTWTLHDAIDNAIHMWFAAVKKLPKVFVLGRHRAPMGIDLQSKYCSLQSVEPSNSGIRVFHVEGVVEGYKIALGTRHNPNRVSHAWP